MDIAKIRDALEDALATSLRKCGIGKATGFDVNALAASMMLFIWDDVEPALVEAAIPARAASKVVTAAENTAIGTSAAPPATATDGTPVFDWSSFGRGKKPERPNKEIAFHSEGGQVRIRAEFYAPDLEEVVNRIRRQLDYWNSEPK